ncbi:MAG TPA: hypothetical protein VMW38_00390 [Terriglobia bacterium]|nr:hypothetical protein [Terriglobia bacterium]
MFRRLWISMLLILNFCCGIGQAQSVDELLAKHLQAVGGAEKIAALQSLRMTGKITMIPLNDFRKAAGLGQEAPVTLMVKRPNQVRMEIDRQGKKVVQAYDGKEKAWGLQPDATEPDMLFDDEGGMGEMMALLLEDLAEPEGPLVNAKDKWKSVDLEGKEGSAADAAFRLKLSPKEGFVRSALLGGKTFLLQQTLRPGSDFQLETSYGDYQPFNGVQLARTIESRIDGELFVRIRIDSVEVPNSLEDAVFQAPAKKE